MLILYALKLENYYYFCTSFFRKMEILKGEKFLSSAQCQVLPFDPTQYEFDDNEEYSTSGIKLIKSLTDSMSYMRILNLNNTVFELKIKGE